MSNCLSEFFDADRIFTLPWLGKDFAAGDGAEKSASAADAPRAGIGVIQFFGGLFAGVLV